MPAGGLHPPHHPLEGLTPAEQAGHERPTHPDDGAISGNPRGQSRCAAVLPHGRFLRDVLSGCGGRLCGAGYRADQARHASGRADPDVRRAGPCRRKLSSDPDPQGVPGRHRRTDGGPGRGQEARLEIGRRARRGAAGHAGYADRGIAARSPAAQFSGQFRQRARRLGAGLGRHLDRRIPCHGLHAAPAGAGTGPPRPARAAGPRGHAP